MLRAMRRISAAVRMPRLTSHHATFHTFVSRGNVCKLVTPPAFPALKHNTRRALRTLPDRTQLSHAEKSPHAERGARTLDGVQRSEIWHDMDASTQALWQALGWDRHNWAHGPNPPSDDLDWVELSGAQQAAASALGYSERTWDQDSGNPFGGESSADPMQGPLGMAMGLAFIGMPLGAAMLRDHLEMKRVELSYEQRCELRELVTRLELPETPKKAQSSWLKPWRQAAPRQKEKVADKYLSHLHRVFDRISDHPAYITRARWEELQNNAASRGDDSDAARAVCGAVFSKGGRGMRLCPTDKPTRAEAKGALSFRAFATLCTLLAASEQGDVHSQARLVFFLVDEDADGVISRDELRGFVATCLDATCSGRGSSTGDCSPSCSRCRTAPPSRSASAAIRATRHRSGASTRRRTSPTTSWTSRMPIATACSTSTSFRSTSRR